MTGSSNLNPLKAVMAFKHIEDGSILPAIICCPLAILRIRLGQSTLNNIPCATLHVVDLTTSSLLISSNRAAAAATIEDRYGGGEIRYRMLSLTISLGHADHIWRAWGVYVNSDLQANVSATIESLNDCQ